MNFAAVLTPVLAIVSMMYLLKVLGLGNLLKPSNAIAMATGGAGKIMGTGDDFGKKMSSVVSGDARRQRAQKRQDNLSRADTRSKMLARGGKRALAAPGKRAGNALGTKLGEHKHKKTLNDKEKEAFEAKKAAEKKGHKRPMALKAQDWQDAAVRSLGTAGVFLTGPAAQGKAATAFKAMSAHANRGEVELRSRQQAKELAGQLKGVRGTAKREEITAGFYNGLVGELGTATRIDPETGLKPAAFGLMTEDQAVEYAATQARALGHADPHDLIVDRFAGIALTGVQKSKIPNMGNDVATLAAAQQMHHYFPSEFRAKRPGESDEDWGHRMTAALVVKGGIDTESGEFVNMLDKFGYRDTAEHRQMLQDAANPKKGVPPLFDKTISISSQDEAKINAMLANSQVQENRSELRRAVVSKKGLDEVVAPQVAEVSVKVTNTLADLGRLLQPAASASGLVDGSGKTLPAHTAQQDQALGSFIENTVSSLLSEIATVNQSIAGLKDHAGRGEIAGAMQTAQLSSIGSEEDIMANATRLLIAAQNSSGAERLKEHEKLKQHLTTQLSSLIDTTRASASQVEEVLSKSIKESELVVFKAANRQVPNGQTLSKGFSLPPSAD